MNNKGRKVKSSYITLATIIALIGITIVPTTVMGAIDDPTTGVSGTVGEYYTITAPSDISWPNLTTAGASATGLSLSVETNSSSAQNVVISASALNMGKLSCGGVPLSTALEITIPPHIAKSLEGEKADLTDPLGLAGSNVKTWNTNTMTIAQPAFAGTAAGAYTTTITFTVTFG